MKYFGRFVLAACVFLSYGPAEAATLTITNNGSVSGAVSVIGPNGNVCNPNPGGGGGGGTCTFTYAAGTPLRLTANSPNTPGIFNSGTGDAELCATSTCTFTIHGDSSIIATFAAGDFRSIQIDLGGDGKGNVGTDNSQCQNFELGSNVCTSFYGAGSVVTLEGRSVPGNIFEGFSGGTADAAGCGPATPCVFTLNVNSSIDASFSALTSVAVQNSAPTINVGQTTSFPVVGTFANSATRPLFGGSGFWRTVRPMTAARFVLGVGVVNNLLYAVGGVSGYCSAPPCDYSPLATVEMYNPAATGFGGIDSWTPRASMLIPRGGHAVAVVNGKIYALGGHTSGGGAVATTEVYDPSANSWTPRASMPEPRVLFAAAVIDNVIYAVGGVASDAATQLNTLHAYDPVSDTWTTKAPMLTARSYLAAAVVNGKLYALGGVPNTSTVEEYDPGTNTWTTKAPMPMALANMAAGVLDGLIYVIGGQGGPAPVGTAHVYNPATDTWTTLPGSMLTPRTSLAIGAFDGRLFAVGGLTTISPDSAPAAATNEAFRPPETTWWSSNTTVATINQNNGNGTATGQSAGTTTISARAVGIDSGGQSATLTVTAGGGGSSSISLGLPNSAFTQVGNAPWGCGSFFGSQNPAGPWSATVNYGDGSGTQVLTLTIPMPAVNPCGSGTGMFVFNHVYAVAGMFQVSVTVTNTGTGATKAGGFPIEVSEDGGGGDGCTLVSTNFLAGSVPFSTVQMSLFDRSTGELLFTEDIPLGMTELGEAPEGLYRVELSVPPGYIITPAEIAFDAICGDDVVLSAQIGLADTTPPALTLPGNITRDATSPSGAAVSFAATAIDLVDGAVAVHCTPASGSTFGIGMTTVNCLATDAHANTAMGSFTVTVLSPSQIIAKLIAEVGALNFQQGNNILRNALRSLDRGNTSATCNQLGAFINQVQAQSGRQLTTAEATALIESATAARGALGCG